MSAPGTVEGVQAAIRAARSDGARIRILGSGHDLGLGGNVVASGELRTSELRGIEAFDPDELVVRVKGGTPVGDLHSLLAEHRLRAVLPDDPPTRTVGGAVATGTSGPARLRYGPLRNQVIGVTMVTGAGDVVRAGGQVVKNVTGYDLARLTVGSLGRLGVVADVTMRVYAVRGEERVVKVPDAEAAWRQPFRPLAVLGTRTGAWMWIDGSSRALESAVARARGEVVTPAALPATADWDWRATIRGRPSTQMTMLEGLPSSWQYVVQHGTGLTTIGGGAWDPEMLGLLRQRVERDGGRVVVHRIPAGAAPVEPWGTPPDGLHIQRRIIDAFDPQSVLNPGILPGGL